MKIQKDDFNALIEAYHLYEHLQIIIRLFENGHGDPKDLYERMRELIAETEQKINKINNQRNQK